MLHISCFRSFSSIDKVGLATKCCQHSLLADGTKGMMMQALRAHWAQQVDLAAAISDASDAACGGGRVQDGSPAAWLSGTNDRNGFSSCSSSWGSPVTDRKGNSQDAAEVARNILYAARLEADDVCKKAGISPRRTVGTQTP